MVHHLDPRYLLRCACIVIGVLGVLHMIGWTLMLADVSIAHADGLLFPLLNLDGETGLGTYYSTVQLTFVAVLVLATAAHVRGTGGAMASQWLAMGGLLLFVAVNEHLTVREQISHDHSVQVRGVAISSWVVPGILVVAILGVVFWRFLRRLPSPIGALVMLGGATYTVGVIGFELLGNWVFSRSGLGTAWSVAALGEEVFELLGVAIVGYAAARFLQEFVPPLAVTTEAASASRPDGESEGVISSSN